MRFARPTAAALLAATMLSAITLSAVPTAAQMFPGTSGGIPVEINADQAIEWHQDVRAYVARGNASAKRGDSTVFADALTAYYREIPGKGNEVFQLVGEGNVRIVAPNQQVFGDRAVYDVDKQTGVVTGRNLKLVTPNDVVTARDSLEYYDAKGLAVARGDAVAVRQDRRLRADVLIGQFVKGPDGATTMQRIDGAGNVVVTTPNDVAQSEKLVYSVADNTAVLLGDVRITRGDNQLNGEAAEMNMTTKINRVIAGPKSGGRVQGLLVPGSEPGAAPGGKPAAGR
ncbi:LptA/OstA family protein [Azospirillum sp.]|uniref:LptA/OstA family protein n=1 Tax=Azospirillum sp. TaxID=34012 RepID=UPI002D31842F|nr:LptA/OstA family protein [Azospirillum sp.]HYD68648.1 LptA/OstA family protein [Azospirillum sp.]